MMLRQRATLSNGTVVEITDTGTRVTLPCGAVVAGEPQNTDHQKDIARRLGYGDDDVAMVRDHDALHAMLCDWLGLPDSPALRAVAGLASEDNVSWDEEAAVMAVQQFMRSSGGRMPVCRAVPEPSSIL